MTAQTDDALEAVLRKAGPRPAPPEAVAAAVYAQTRRAWETQVQRRAVVRRGYSWAANVLLLLLASWGAWTQYPHEIMAMAPAGQDLLVTHTKWHPLAPHDGGGLYAGDAVQSGAADALLRRPDGGELRLARNSRLSFSSPTELRLSQGQLFVHTGAGTRTHDLVVVTDLGSVEHIGTQFLVDRQGNALMVAVRDGRVAVHYAQHAAAELQGGQAMHVDPGGELRRWDLAAFDSIWDWADAMATPLAIDGHSLYAVLDQIAQRAGLTLNFTTPAVEAEARRLALHGAPLELPPHGSLDAVLATTTLRGAADGRQILVSAR